MCMNVLKLDKSVVEMLFNTTVGDDCNYNVFLLFIQPFLDFIERLP